MQETQQMRVWSLRREGPQEEGLATYSSIPAWKMSWTKEPGGLQSMGWQKELDTTEQLNNNNMGK